MSDSKKEKTKLTHSHEISVSDFSEDVPGVTQLLNPNLANLRKKESAPSEKPFEEKEKTIAIRLDDSPLDEGSIVLSSPNSKKSTPPLPKISSSSPLAAFGVHFQLLFQEEGGSLRYQGVKEIGDAIFEKWRHSFFQNMKIEPRTLGISVSFQEFAADRFPLQKEAFGLSSDDFIQCVRDPADRKKMHVLISKKSLLGKKNEIEEALSSGSSNANPGSGEIKIELDS